MELKESEDIINNILGETSHGFWKNVIHACSVAEQCSIFIMFWILHQYVQLNSSGERQRIEDPRLLLMPVNKLDESDSIEMFTVTKSSTISKIHEFNILNEPHVRSALF